MTTEPPRHDEPAPGDCPPRGRDRHLAMEMAIDLYRGTCVSPGELAATAETIRLYRRGALDVDPAWPIRERREPGTTT